MQSRETAVDRNEQGKDFTVRLNGEEIPVTHLRYSIDPTGCYNEGNLTERPASGSFEYVGHNEHVRQVVESHTDPGAELATLEIESPNEHIRCSVAVEDYSRNASGDGRSLTTLVWEGITVEFVDESPSAVLSLLRRIAYRLRSAVA